MGTNAAVKMDTPGNTAKVCTQIVFLKHGKQWM